MSFQIEKKTLMLYLFIAYMILASGAFYLIDGDALPITDIGFMVGFLFLACGCVRLRVKNMQYVWFAAFGILLSLTSSVAAYKMTGQSVFFGLRPQRQYILAWLLYFALVQVFDSRLIREKLIRSIRICAYIQLFLYFLQYLLANRIVFLNIIINERYGTPRLYGEFTFILLMFLISLSEQIASPTLIRRNVIEILATLCYIMFVRKGRMQTIVFIGLVVFALLKWKGAKTNKIFAFLILFIAAGFLLNDEIIELFMSAITNSSSESNVEVRSLARTYYLEKLADSPWFGMGFINSDYIPAAKMAGIYNGYLVVDNGIYGYLYQYGLIGLAWCLALLGKLLHDGWILAKVKNDYTLILYVIYVIVGAQSGHWISYFESTIIVVFMCFYANSKLGILQYDSFGETSEYK